MKKITLILLTLLLLTNCKKLRSKAPLTVDITCQNPVDGSAFPGVIFKIYEVKDKFSIGLSVNQKKELIYTGTTNVNGKANYEFDAIKNSKFSYEIFFDYSNMDVPVREYDLSKTSNFNYLKKNESNVYHYSILPYANLITHTKNINCIDSTDKKRTRWKYLYTGSGNWTFWSTDDIYYLYGCQDKISHSYIVSDYLVYETEVTRNNITSSFIDTFYVYPENSDTLKIYY